MNTKFLCVLLLLTIIFSSVLIYKIEQTPKYNTNVYSQVYNEYNQIKNTLQESALNSSTKDNIVIYNKNSSNSTYRTVGIIDIPKINISYPIINECTEENLNIAPTKLAGPMPNSIGNLVIIAHNNWNQDFFSRLHELKIDDIVELIDTSGNKLKYKVYDILEIKQDDFSCLEQDTNGRTELTLITCIKYQKTKRLVVKCVANSI